MPMPGRPPQKLHSDGWSDMTRDDDLLVNPVYFFCPCCGTAYQYLYPGSPREPDEPPRCHTCLGTMRRVFGLETLCRIRDAFRQAAIANARLSKTLQAAREGKP